RASAPARWVTPWSLPSPKPLPRASPLRIVSPHPLRRFEPKGIGEVSTTRKGIEMRVVGLVGWRGMVGSVLMDRMQAEGDFARIEPVFFSTSNAGGKAPSWAKNENTLKDAHDIEALKRCDIVITAQGG